MAEIKNNITKYITTDNLKYFLIKLFQNFKATKDNFGGIKIGYAGTSGNNVARKPVELDSDGKAYVEIWKDATGDIGSDNQPIYFKEGQPEASVLNAGTPTQPVYFKEGVITECEDIGQMLKDILDPSVKNIKFNPSYNRLEIKTDIKTTDETTKEEVITEETFVTEALTKLETPSAPSIEQLEYILVTDDASVAVKNTFKYAVILQYRIKTNGATDWSAWTQLGDTVTETSASQNFIITTGYANDKPNPQIVKNVQVKAIYKGEESVVADFNITIKPRVAQGSIDVNYSSYGTSFKVIVKPSATTGSTSEYSKDGGTSWTSFSKETTIITETASESTPTKYTLNVKVRATKDGYEDAEYAEIVNQSYTIGQKKVYYGFSTKDTLGNKTDIMNLANSGGKVNSTTIASNNLYSVKPDNFKNTSPYLWVCMTGTINQNNIFANAESVIPMGFNEAIQCDGWNCYRLNSTVTDLDGNTTFIYKTK